MSELEQLEFTSRHVAEQLLTEAEDPLCDNVKRYEIRNLPFILKFPWPRIGRR